MGVVGWAGVIFAVRDWWSLTAFLIFTAVYIVLEERKRLLQQRRARVPQSQSLES
jgi:protein-S-isoprenylcysteine O-methyltransferase Ste14